MKRQSPDRDRWRRLEPALFVTVVMGLFLAGAARTSLFDRDEPRYLGTALHMLAGGDFTVPYFNDAFRFQKPVLTYWLLAAALHLAGTDPAAVTARDVVAARLVPALCVTLGLLLVRRTGAVLYGRRGAAIGRLAGWLLLACPVILLLGKLCIPDGPQFLCACACWWALAHALRNRDRVSVPATPGPLPRWERFAGFRPLSRRERVPPPCPLSLWERVRVRVLRATAFGGSLVRDAATFSRGEKGSALPCPLSHRERVPPPCPLSLWERVRVRVLRATAFGGTLVRDGATFSRGEKRREQGMPRGVETHASGSQARPQRRSARSGPLLCPSLPFWLAVSASVLLKGPIVLGMVAAFLLTYGLLTGDWRWPLRWRLGALVTAAACLPWLAAVRFAAGDAFYAESVGHQLGGRLAASFDGRVLPPGYYAASLAVGVGPWLALATLAAVRCRRRLRRAGPAAFLVAWAIGPMVLVELFRSKQPHYYAPAYPALALLAAHFLTLLPRLRPRRDWATRATACAVAAMTLSLPVGMAALALRGPHAGAPAAWAAAVLAGLAAALCWRRRGRPAALVRVQVAGAAAVFAALGLCWLPACERDRLMRPLADALRTHATPGRRVLAHKLFEPSLHVYSGVPVRHESKPHRFLPLAAATDGEILMPVTAAELATLRPLLDKRIDVLATLDGWVKMHPDRVHLVLLRPSPPPLSADRPVERVAAQGR